MIEIIQEGQAEPKIKLPRNLRQIGSPNGEYKIYVEDFVYTFLHPVKEEETGDTKVAILVGKKEKENGILYYFIKGAFYIEEIEFEKGLPQFTEEIWGSVYKLMKEYFDDEDPEKSLQILGWTYITGGMPPRLNSDVERIHRMNFKEKDTLLLILDDVEKEENFYVYEKGNLRKKEGYYIFYEQNPQMQEYMVQYREKRNPSQGTEIVTDEVARSYREKISMESYSGKRHWNMVGYAACTVLVVSVFVLGVNSIGNKEKMEQLQETVSMIAGNFEQGNTQKTKDQNGDDLVVTTVDGDVEPLEETAETSAEGKKADASQQEGQPAEEQNAPETQEEEKQESTGEQNAGQESAEQGNDVQETAAPAPTEAETILAQGYYIVKNGDSLESISTKIYGNTSRVGKIKEINQIENADSIFAGQKLILP